MLGDFIYTPEKMTLVPVVKLVKSKVVPAGTTMLLKVMVEQDFLPLATCAAVVKVQEVALSLRARSVTSAAGAAMAEVARSATEVSLRRDEKKGIVNCRRRKLR